MSIEEQKSNALNDIYREILPSSTSGMLLFLPNNKQVVTPNNNYP